MINSICNFFNPKETDYKPLFDKLAEAKGYVEPTPAVETQPAKTNNGNLSINLSLKEKAGILGGAMIAPFKNLGGRITQAGKELEEKVNKEIKQITDLDTGIEANNKSKEKIIKKNEQLETKISEKRAALAGKVKEAFYTEQASAEFTPSEGKFAEYTNFFKKFHHNVEQTAASAGQTVGKSIHAVVYNLLNKTIGNAALDITGTEDNTAQINLERAAFYTGIAADTIVKNATRLGHAAPYVAAPFVTIAGIIAALVVAAIFLPISYAVASPMYVAEKLYSYFTQETVKKEPEVVQPVQQEEVAEEEDFDTPTNWKTIGLHVGAFAVVALTLWYLAPAVAPAVAAGVCSANATASNLAEAATPVVENLTTLGSTIASNATGIFSFSTPNVAFFRG